MKRLRLRRPRLQRRTLALVAVIVPMVLLFAHVALRSGPLAPVAVTATTVEERAIAPALAGIGTVQARYTYRIGPTYAGRVRRIDVQVGDRVRAGQVLRIVATAFTACRRSCTGATTVSPRARRLTP